MPSGANQRARRDDGGGRGDRHDQGEWFRVLGVGRVHEFGDLPASRLELHRTRAGTAPGERHHRHRGAGAVGDVEAPLVEQLENGCTLDIDQELLPRARLPGAGTRRFGLVGRTAGGALLRQGGLFAGQHVAGAFIELAVAEPNELGPDQQHVAVASSERFQDRRRHVGCGRQFGRELLESLVVSGFQGLDGVSEQCRGVLCRGGGGGRNRQDDRHHDAGQQASQE